MLYLSGFLLSAMEPGHNGLRNFPCGIELEAVKYWEVDPMTLDTSQLLLNRSNGIRGLRIGIRSSDVVSVGLSSHAHAHTFK